MPQSELTDRSIIALVRTIVQASISEAQAAVRTPRILTGVVEDMDADLDVVYVRMDQEATSGDPTLSNNWDFPGVIAATRLGETVIGEQVQVTFHGPAGASATNTSVPTRIVRPFGVETGQRMVFDGATGTIEFYDLNDNLVGQLTPAQWGIGTPGSQRVVIDPISGIKLFDGLDGLRLQMSAIEGLILRTPTGSSGVLLGPDGLVVIDPATGDRISITSGGTSALPTPRWAGLNKPLAGTGPAPGSAHDTPAVTGFGTGDDLDLRFVAASELAELGAVTYTPPTNWTEQLDVVASANGLTQAVTVGSRDPAEAAPALAAFTSTSSAWDLQVGHSVIVQGGGASSPSVRAVAHTTLYTTDLEFDATIPIPTGTAEGDVLLAFAAVTSDWIPIGWSTPDGWKQLGLQTAGVTPGVHLLASGIWYRRGRASEPASEVVRFKMYPDSHFARVRVVTVAIQNPYAFPAGLDIRRNNRSMPRGLVAEAQSTTDGGTWTNLQLPQTLEEITGIPLLAGRKYRIAYNIPIFTFANLGNGLLRVQIEMDTGSGYALWRRTERANDGGVTTGELNIERTYTPAADQTISLRIRVVNAASGSGWNVTLYGAGDDYRRILTVDDIGAVF